MKEVIEKYKTNPTADNFSKVMKYPTLNSLSTEEQNLFDNFINDCI